MDLLVPQVRLKIEFDFIFIIAFSGLGKVPNEPSCSNSTDNSSSRIEHTSSDTDDLRISSDSSCDELSSLSSSYSESASDLKPNNDPLENLSLEECVRYWALQTNQDHNSINLIMRIISTKTDGILPRDARTLLRTSREKVVIENIGGGQYWYHGIRQCLIDFYRYFLCEPFQIE